MRNDERTFQVYDLELAAQKDGAAVPTMLEAVDVWQKLKDAGRSYPVKGGDGTMLIGDIKTYDAENIVVLLIRLSDKKAPNSVYSDPEAGAFDEHLKTGNMGADFGCHVIVSLAPESGKPNIYTCAVERVTGLAPALVQRILSKFFNYEYHDNVDFFKYPSPGVGFDKTGNPKQDRCCPHLELRGRASETMISDINNGRLSGISLVKAETVTPIAGASYLKKSRSELKLSIDHLNLPENLWSSITKVLKANSQDYGQAKIQYRVPNSKRSVTVELDSVTAQPLSDLYVQSFDIKPIFPPLAQSTSVVVERLTDLAIVQVLKNRTV